MTRKTVFFLTTFLGLATGACDSGGDTGTDGGSSGTGTVTTDDGDTGVAATTGSTATATTGATGTVTSAGSESTGSQTSIGSEGSEGSETGSDSSGASADAGSDGSTGAPTEQDLCEASGGTWDDTACGHYVCGEPNLCEALIPGCDCGPSMNFREGEGCQADEACEAKPATFACGEESVCSVDAEYCEVFFPGVQGASISYTCRDMPEACDEDASCECLEEELGFGFAATCTEDILTGGETLQIFGA